MTTPQGATSHHREIILTEAIREVASELGLEERAGVNRERGRGGASERSNA